MENEFTKIGSYQYSSEAVIIKGKLEAEGITVFMADNFTIDADPLMSNAIGGVKLFIKTEQLEEAKNILSAISRYSLDNEGKAIHCPNCNGEHVSVGSTINEKKSLFSFLFSFALFGALPLYTKYKYRCDDCGAEFEIK